MIQRPVDEQNPSLANTISQYKTKFKTESESKQTKVQTDSEHGTFLHTRMPQTTSTTSTQTGDGKEKEAVTATATGGSQPKVHQEHQYIDLVKRILDKGEKRADRTKVGTLSVFGARMAFDVSTSFPLLTTKRLYWRGIVEELLWIISGCTDSKVLDDKKVKIWNPNGTRKFLDNRGLVKNRVGDLGPVYGFQWRHSGAKYVDCDTDYTGQGVDQLQNVINLIKTNPTSRRIILSAWNPSDLDKMALPPCHVLCQFYVTNDGKLNCQLYMRSNDIALGAPFNVASYVLLMYMIAHLTGLKPGRFIHIIGDAHIYLNNIKGIRTQILRDPQPFPTLRIKRTAAEIKTIDGFKFEDFELVGYKPHPRILMPMAV